MEAVVTLWTEHAGGATAMSGLTRGWGWRWGHQNEGGECKTRFLEHGLKEMGLCSLRKDRHVGNESRLEYMTSWLKAELDLFFMILGLERYD